jgi:8-oxo-dGTP diphosphatase
VAAVVEDGDCVLVTERPPGTHLAGHWEFPGGKCEEGEAPEEALRRELREELDVEADIGEELFRTEHRYPDRLLELRFYRCTLLGAPRPQQGQGVRWVRRAELRTLAFPPADEAFIERLVDG